MTDGNLQVQFPPVMLRLKLDNELAPRWEDGEVSVATLWEDFAKYVYLPRLRDQDVLLATVESGPASVTWQSEGFGVAVGADTVSGRYLQLAAGSHPGSLSPQALIVRSDFALGQLESERDEPGEPDEPDGGDGGPEAVAASVFRGSLYLDPARAARDFGQVTQEVLQHLTSQVGSDVEVKVEITARKSDGSRTTSPVQ